MNKHAYMIIAHNDIELLKKLVSVLDAPYNDIYIHYDKKSYSEELHSIKTKYSQLLIISEISVNWGSYSIIECELRLLEIAIQSHYSYYHLLSGSDLPIKPNKMIYNFFENSKKQFVLFSEKEFPDMCYDWVAYRHVFAEKYKTKRTRIGNKMLFVLDDLFVLVQKLLQKEKKLYFKKHQKGSQWFSITEDFAEYILSLKDKIESDFKDSFIPDEVVIPTILVNSEWKSELYCTDNYNSPEQNSRYIDWERGRPYVFGIADLEELSNSKCMFARKFSSESDREIIDVMVDRCKFVNN